MSNDNKNLGPDDIARFATEQLALRRAAQSTFDDMGKVQRLAANRSPAELRDEALACLNALAVQHTVTLRMLEANMTDAAGSLVDAEELEDALRTTENYAGDRGKLGVAKEILGSFDCDYPPPSPEELEEFFFADFQEPTTEGESGEVAND